MNPADEPSLPDAEQTGGPDPATKSVRDEIQQFFGVKGGETPDRGRDRAGFDRLLEDLESRILGSIREPQAPPHEIGPFILEERIGRGGFAVVYRATHKRTGARAAVKLMPASDDSARRRIATEVESLIRLRHPNIVRVIDTGEDAGWAWIATDLIPGMTLADFIRTKRSAEGSFQIGDASKSPSREDRSGGKPAPIDAATLRLAMTWFRDLAGALGALHAANLVHRDVKPANILIDSEQRPFLIDFGLSSSAETTVDGILAGTVPYMSPEQTLGGWVAITPRSDVYSLAVTFHEVLTGRRVTQGLARETMLRQIAFVPVVPPSEVAPGVPASLDPIFAKALAKNEERRHASARDLAVEIDGWLNQGLVTRVLRFVRRHPVGVALVSVVALALIGWGAWKSYSAEAAYRQDLAQIRKLIDARDKIGALALVRQLLPAYGTRDDFVALHRHAIELGSSDLAGRLLEPQAFAISRLWEQSSLKELESAAATHLTVPGRADPHLILILGLCKLFRGDVSGAKAVLDGHQEEAGESVPLTELRAIIAIRKGDKGDYEEAKRRLSGFKRVERTWTDKCLTAWRLLLADSVEDFPKPTTDELKDAEDAVSGILTENPDHALARGLRAQLRLARKSYREAYDDFDRLLAENADKGDKVGRKFMRGIAGLLAAQDESASALLPTALKDLEEAIEGESSLLFRSLAMLRRHEATLAIRAVWFERALKRQWATRPKFDENFLAYAVETIGMLFHPEEDYATVISLSDALVAEYGQRSEPTEEALLNTRQLEVIALDGVASRAIDAGNKEGAIPLVRKARAIINWWYTTRTPLPYRMLARDALLAARTALLEPGAQGENAAAAIKLLRNAIAPTVIDKTRDEAKSPQELEEIDDLETECKAALSRLEMIAGPASR